MKSLLLVLLPFVMIAISAYACQSSEKDYFAVGWKIWGECTKLCGGADKLWSVSELRCECMDRTQHKHSRSPLEFSDQPSKSIFEGLK